jgi:hypothetical protein
MATSTKYIGLVDVLGVHVTCMKCDFSFEGEAEQLRKLSSNGTICPGCNQSWLIEKAGQTPLNTLDQFFQQWSVFKKSMSEIPKHAPYLVAFRVKED